MVAAPSLSSLVFVCSSKSEPTALRVRRTTLTPLSLPRFYFPPIFSHHLLQRIWWPDVLYGQPLAAIRNLSPSRSTLPHSPTPEVARAADNSPASVVVAPSNSALSTPVAAGNHLCSRLFPVAGEILLPETVGCSSPNSYCADLNISKKPNTFCSKTLMMNSTNGVATKLELFEVGPCQNAYQLGYQIGHRFSSLIRSRLASDLILQNQLRPFSMSQPGQQLTETLSKTNRDKFPAYWDELMGTAEGSVVPILDILLINFRKEILPFIPKKEESTLHESMADDCSDIMVVNNNMAIVAHNEDANVALLGHTYLIRVNICDGQYFTAYTYAGELPSCAFGFNSHGLAFTLDSVPPCTEEIKAGGIARNFISRGLLDAKSIDDALRMINSLDVSVGHSYNLIDVPGRRIFNVETASRGRISVQQVEKEAFFHANMYLHLGIHQVEDESSRSRHNRSALVTKQSKNDFLSLLGNTDNKEYPIYMEGPTLYTLCTAVFDLDEHTLSIIEGNPKEQKVVYLFHMTLQQLRT